MKVNALTQSTINHLADVFQDLRKDHLERWILQLLDEVVIQQALLELIDGATDLSQINLGVIRSPRK